MDEKFAIVKKDDYGVLTEASKDLNSFFGDSSGRTVSRRTAHGLKKGLDLDIDDNSVELIVHSGMVASGALLKSEDDTANGIGLLLLAGLVACYLNGK
jgi:hypothetical protein